MRLILGIGNPGNRYRYNRHNVGFIALDHFASLNSLSFLPSNGDYFYSEGNFEGNNFQLIKPTTFVNNSGFAARQAIDQNKTEVSDLLVIHDDVDLSHAEIRIKVKGGNVGHNGIDSILYQLASEDFARIRIGIGNNFEKGQMADYVLSNFSSDEFELLNETFKATDFLIREFILGGLNGLLDANSRISNRSNKNSETNEKGV